MRGVMLRDLLLVGAIDGGVQCEGRCGADHPCRGRDLHRAGVVHRAQRAPRHQVRHEEGDPGGADAEVDRLRIVIEIDADHPADVLTLIIDQGMSQQVDRIAVIGALGSEAGAVADRGAGDQAEPGADRHANGHLEVAAQDPPGDAAHEGTACHADQPAEELLWTRCGAVKPATGQACSHGKRGVGVLGHGNLRAGCMMSQTPTARAINR